MQHCRLATWVHRRDASEHKEQRDAPPSWSSLLLLLSEAMKLDSNKLITGFNPSNLLSSYCNAWPSSQPVWLALLRWIAAVGRGQRSAGQRSGVHFVRQWAVCLHLLFWDQGCMCVCVCGERESEREIERLGDGEGRGKEGGAEYN